ncbi:MAG: hypothetical protein HDQ99_05565 [Lachnospiraceae bacterium]|nr:hypothetical protein [Lachnospiraceae bacterium]
MKTKQYEYLILEEHWNDVRYNLIDFPSIQTVLQNVDQDFIKELSLLDENFISNILNNIS